MKQTLGKLIILIFFTIDLFATNVSLDLDTPAIYKGDIASFTIMADSSDVEFPDIEDIEGFTILGKSSSSSTSIINGRYSKKVSTTYSFRPTKDVTIPSFSVKVDGDTLKTTPKKISVIKPTKSKDGDKFVVELSVKDTTLKVGQSTRLKIIFKRRLDAKADKLNLNEPKIENFWVKPIDGSKQYSKGQYIVQEFSYIIFAQKAGKFTIEPVEVDVGKVVRDSRNSFFNDPFFSSMTNQLRWSKIYSNSITVDVEPLPNNMELYGDFTIKASVDKNEVYANKPVDVTISIDGEGNVDDIKQFDINIPNVVTYPDKPTVEAKVVNGEYKGTFTQKIVCIGDANFTIPPFELKYFDKKTQKVKTIQTKAIDIKVKNSGKIANAPVVQKIETSTKPIEKVVSNIVTKEDDTQKYLYMLIGFILGVGLTYILTKPKKETIKKEKPIVVEIKKAKDDKTLFNLLLPYAKEYDEVGDILNKLEENIYKNGTNKIDKQKLYDIFL